MVPIQNIATGAFLLGYFCVTRLLSQLRICTWISLSEL